ncbi:MAG: hypothetical protein RLZ26_732 [Pseudomonadota bacterium]
MSRKGALHEDIESLLRDDITSGACPVGVALPTEHELAQRHCVSRATVRRALASLRASGMVEPRKGHGTFVIADRPRPGFVQTLSDFGELLQYPEGTLREKISTTELSVTGERAALLDCPSGTEWVRLEALRRRHSDGQPFAGLTAWMRPALADVADRPNPEGRPLLRQIEEVHGLRARLALVDVFAASVPAEWAVRLDVPPGAAALMIRRRYRGIDRRIYLATESLHPEGRFALSFEIARG